MALIRTRFSDVQFTLLFATCSYILYNYVLVSLDGSFGNVRNTGNYFYIYYNYVLQSLGTTAFQNLQTSGTM